MTSTMHHSQHHHHQSGQQQLPQMDPAMFAFAHSSQAPTPYPAANATELYTQMLLAAAAAQQQQQPLDATAVAAAAAGMGGYGHHHGHHGMMPGMSAAPDAVMTMNAAAILAAHALSTTSPLWSSANTSPSAISPFAGAMPPLGGAYSSGGFAPNVGFGGSGSFGASGGMAAQAPQPAPKRYSHNPYASDPSTPTTPQLGASFSAGSNSLHGMSGAAAAPGLPMNGSDMMLGGSGHGYPGMHGGPSFGGASQSGPSVGGEHGAYGIADQFAQLKGNMASAACTSRGRHVLIATLRLQHADKLQAILEEIIPAFVAVVADANGSHVIRTLFEFLSEEQSAALLSSLSAEAILALATSSQHSRRVLQSALERHRHTAATTLQPIVDVIACHALSLATGQQGCIAVMRVVENCTDAQKKQILHTVRAELPSLTTDPYGNYVVQTLIQNLPRDVASEVIDKAFEGQFVGMCCNKFASNVMEKIVHAATPPTRKMILEEICYNAASLQMVMQDGFGNFVLQSIIDTCTTGCEYRRLCDRIRPLLTCSPYGHKIEAKLRSKRFNAHGN